MTIGHRASAMLRAGGCVLVVSLATPERPALPLAMRELPQIGGPARAEVIFDDWAGPIVPLPGWPVGVATGGKAAMVGGLGPDRGAGAAYPEEFAHLFDAFGMDHPGWPATFAPTGREACFADYDGDGEPEVFFAGDGTKIYGLHADATHLANWPARTDPLPLNSITSPCSIGDLDGDGTYELVAGTGSGKAYVWGEGASVLPGWPVTLPMIPRPRVALLPTIFRPPALGDLDGDGTLEVVLTSQNGLLHVFRMDGSDFPGFPYDLNAGNTAANNPILADVDEDGSLEIILAATGQPPLRELHPQLHVIRANGQPQSGFPKVVNASINGGAAVADLDGDGRLWILANHYDPQATVAVWDALTGAMRDGFPVTHGLGTGATATPMVADITGDSAPDIVWTQSFEGRDFAKLFAWNRFGNRVSPFPLAVLPGDFMSAASPTLADLNLDGRIDTLVATFAIGLIVPFPPPGARLSAYDLGRRFDARTLEWPMEWHDVRHTGVYSPPVDELRLGGRFQQEFVFLEEPPAALLGRLTFLDRRRDLARELARGGVRIVAVNDRPIGPIPARAAAVPGFPESVAAPAPDLLVQFDGRAVAGAILDRLRRAGVEASGERDVRLKVESPHVDRRLVGGEVRLRVRMPVGG